MSFERGGIRNQVLNTELSVTRGPTSTSWLRLFSHLLLTELVANSGDLVSSMLMSGSMQLRRNLILLSSDSLHMHWVLGGDSA